MRCRELARVLRGRGLRSALIGPSRSLSSPGDEGLFPIWEEVPERGDSLTDAGRVVALARQTGAAHVVMDDYRGDPEFQAVLAAAGLRWLQQFDASRPFDFLAPVLVNAGPAERREDYAEYLKNPATETLFGPAHAVLRPEFAAIAPRPDGRAVARVLVAFGGGDDRGAVDLALSALPSGPVPVVVIGRGHPQAQALAARARAQGAEVHVDPPDLAGLMAGCDLALIAGGTMSYEAAILGLPMVLMPLVPNQIRAARGWGDRAGARVIEGYGRGADERNSLCSALSGLIVDHSARAAMAAAGRAAVDGKGAERLLDRLLAEPEGGR